MITSISESNMYSTNVDTVCPNAKPYQNGHCNAYCTKINYYTYMYIRFGDNQQCSNKDDSACHLLQLAYHEDTNVEESTGSVRLTKDVQKPSQPTCIINNENITQYWQQ